MHLALACTACLPAASLAADGAATALGDDHFGGGRGVVAEMLVQSTRDWTGEPLPAWPQGQPEITVMRIVIPAGTALPPHQHPMANAGVLITGRLRVETTDGQVKVLEAGDGLIEVVNRVHFGESLGPDDAVIVVVYAGTQGTPLTLPAR